MRRLLCVWVICLLGLFGTISAGWGEQQGQGTSMSGTLGTVTIDGKQWQRLNLRPEIPIGKFGIALDIELFIDHQGRFNKKGWDFSTGAAITETLLRKIYYLRYGHPGENLFLKVGALDNVSLGYGLIMEGYCNTLEYPGVKKLGLQFGFDGVTPFRIGAEGVVGNFQDFRHKGGLIGLRVFGRPAAPTQTPLLEKLTVGATYVSDINQYSGLQDSDGDDYPDKCDAFPDDKKRWLDSDGDGIEDKDDIDDDGDNTLDADYENYPEYCPFDSAAVADLTALEERGLITLDHDVVRKSLFKHDSADAFSMVGFDAGLPILERAAMRLDLYGQYARIVDDSGDDQAKGYGIAAPGLRFTLPPLVAKIEYRRCQGDFTPGYFNRLYELTRVRISPDGSVLQTGDSTLDSTDTSGIFGELRVELAKLLSLSAGYQYLTATGDSPEREQSFSAQGCLLSRILDLLPRVDQGSAYYQKNRINTKEYGFFQPTPQTLWGYKLGMEVSSGMSIVWHTQYTYTEDMEGKIQSQKFVSIETAMTF